MKNIHRTLVLGCSLVALAGCGADEIVSPGTGGPIIIKNPPAPAPTSSPAPGGGTVTAAEQCPPINSTGGLNNQGVLAGTPTGDYLICRLPETFDVDDVLPFEEGLLYEISNRVNVGTDQGFSSTNTDVTLTIEPGVILFGEGESFFVVNRGNTIESNGTATMPIVWTSRENIEGDVTDSSQAQWGGVVLLGRARVSDCSTLVFNTTPGDFTTNDQCEQQLEGTVVATPFGGADDADSSGSFTFNQIRFSGFELQQSNELQSLTTGGVGSGTTIENVFSFNSSDDGLEFFGGQFNARNIAVIGASDDSLDVDSGARVNLETVVVAQRTDTGDSLIEFDSPDDLADGTPGNALPQSELQVNNFTFVQRSSSSSQIVRARGGAALALSNGVLDTDANGSGICFRIDEQPTLDALIGIDSVVGDCDATTFARGDRSGNADETTDAEVQTAINAAGTNNDFAFTITLTSTFVNGANENGVTAFDATALSSFFAASTFIGAEDDDLADNFGDWTCNSSIVDFGSATGACTSLPVY
ncbi:MAG: hypothetical protein AAF250_03855 [Pseudomonadota bacterium]